MRKLVRLNGRDFEVDSEQIRAVLRRVVPKVRDKYWVKVDGRIFPPKQIVAEVLELPLVSFTTMDANRVLSAVGFTIYSENENSQIVKTESEVLFEEYLFTHGMPEFDFEPGITGSTKKPDYLIRKNGFQLLFEVKEFKATPADFHLGGGFFDPYRPIREKIVAARKKFRDMEQYCCCLVLHNQEKPLVDLDWRFIMGSMLGNAGYSFPVDMRTGQGDISALKPVFLNGGKMHKYEGGEPVSPENTTISAVLVVERYRIGEKRFRLFVHEKEQELGHDLIVPEYLELAEQSAGTERDLSLNKIRVRVHENPYSRIPLPRNLFTGAFDERYGEIEGSVARVFAGEGVVDFEEKSPVAKLFSKA